MPPFGQLLIGTIITKFHPFPPLPVDSITSPIPPHHTLAAKTSDHTTTFEYRSRSGRRPVPTPESTLSIGGWRSQDGCQFPTAYGWPWADDATAAAAKTAATTATAPAESEPKWWWFIDADPDRDL